MPQKRLKMFQESMFGGKFAGFDLERIRVANGEIEGA